SAWIAGETVPGGGYLKAIAIAGKVTVDWLLCIEGAPKSPEDRLIRSDFLGYLTEEAIREGEKEWNRLSRAGKLPAWIGEALPELITPDAVMAELRSVALQAVERARQLYDEQLRFAKIEAQLQRDRERGSRNERS